MRHVELKSCFDTRNRGALREECAKYHRSAFTRLMKDYESLQKLELGEKLMRGNFAEIIYENGDHPVLKIKQDKNLDKHKMESGTLYDYEKLKNMPIPELKEENDSYDDKAH